MRGTAFLTHTSFPFRPMTFFGIQYLTQRKQELRSI